MPILIIFVLACMGLWYGGDGLWVNLTSGKLTTFSIETVEKHGIGNSRYVNITDGTWSNGYVYQYDQKTTKVNYVIFALESAETFLAIEAGEKKPVRVLVKKKASTSTLRLDEWAIKNGAEAEKVEIQGVTLIGFDSIDDSSRKLIQSLGMEISEDVIFIEEGSEPRSLIKNLLMFTPSALFFGFMIFGFFAKDDEDDSDIDDNENLNDDQDESRSRETIKQVMILMMLVDGETDLEEISAIQTYYKQLTGQDYDTSQLNIDIKRIKEDGITLKGLLKEMNDNLSDNGKKMTFESAFMVAAADGVLHDVEKDMLKTIETALHIPDDVVQIVCERHGVKW